MEALIEDKESLGMVEQTRRRLYHVNVDLDTQMTRTEALLAELVPGESLGDEPSGEVPTSPFAIESINYDVDETKRLTDKLSKLNDALARL